MRSLPANLGYHAAGFLLMIAFGLMFDGMARLSPELLTALRYAGSAYILWLAWKLATANVSTIETTNPSGQFLDGVVLLLLNPKAYLIVGVIFSQFLNPADDYRVWRVMWISAVFILNNMIAFHLWALAGSAIAAWFRERHHLRILNGGLGAMLASVGVWMLFA